MARWRLPRAPTSTLSATTLLDGEIVYDTTLDLVRLGDGATPGGRVIGRWTLTGNVEVYIDEDAGSDSTGTGSAAAPFATFEYAYNYMRARFDIRDASITFLIVANTAFSGVITALGAMAGQYSPYQVRVRGNVSAPQNHVLTGSSTRVSVSHGAQLVIDGLTITTPSGSTPSLNAWFGGRILLGQGLTLGTANFAMMQAADGYIAGESGSTIYITGDAPILGISEVGRGLIDLNGISVSFTGTRTFSDVVFDIGEGSQLALHTVAWGGDSASVVGSKFRRTNAGSIVPTGAELLIPGNAAGTSTESYSDFRIVGPSFSVEGATDNAYESILTFTDPTADRTFTFPDASGAIVLNGQASLALNGTPVQTAVFTVLGAAGEVTASPAAPQMCVSNAGDCGISIHSANANTGNIYFGTSGASGNIAGRIAYSHATSLMEFYVAGVLRATFSNAGVLNTTGAHTIAGTQVLSARKTGWGAPAGTLDRTAYTSYAGQSVSAGYVQAEAQATDTAVRNLARVVAALLTDFHGDTSGHGQIGT